MSKRDDAANERKKSQGSDLFIVDNSDSEWKVLQYLKEWCEIARAFDIATGYFEIGSLTDRPASVPAGDDGRDPSTALRGAGARPSNGEEVAAGGWSAELGTAAWYCVDAASGRIAEEPTEIVELIRSTPETPRVTGIAPKKLSEIRAAVERHIKNTYLRQVQAPIGVKPMLKAWMELS